MIRTYKYRLYPTRNQSRILDTTLSMCKDLYNSALQERIEAYSKQHISIQYNVQQNSLLLLKELCPQYEFIYAQVLQDVLHRLDKTFKNFFRRVKSRQGKAGFPRFKSNDRYNSFTYPQKGFEIVDGKLSLSKIGHIKIKLSRALPDIVKNCTVKRELNRWYVCFSVEVQPKCLRLSMNKSIGIDMGIKNFATLSDGAVIDNPKYLKESEDKLKHEQRALSKKRKGSHNRSKQKFILAKVHRKIKDQRNDFQHKVSRNIVNKFDTIYVEDLSISNMIKNHHLAKSISDVSWGYFVQKLEYKAEEAGTRVIRVSPNYTSKTCSVCGYVKHDLTLKDRVWTCPICNTEHDRDVNASENIKQKGIQDRARNARIEACGEIGQIDYSGKQEYVDKIDDKSALPNT